MSVCILYILEQWSSTKEDTHDETPMAGISGKIVEFIKTKNSQKMLLINKVNS